MWFLRRKKHQHHKVSPPLPPGIDPAIDEAIRFARHLPWTQARGRGAVAMLSRVSELAEEPPELLLHVMSIYSGVDFGDYGYITDPLGLGYITEPVKAMDEVIRETGVRDGMHPLILGVPIVILGLAQIGYADLLRYSYETRCAAATTLQSIVSKRLLTPRFASYRSAIRWGLLQQIVCDYDVFQELALAHKAVRSVDDGVDIETATLHDRLILSFVQSAEAYWEVARKGGMPPRMEKIREERRQVWMQRRQDLVQGTTGDDDEDSHKVTIDEITRYARHYRVVNVRNLVRTTDSEPLLEQNPNDLSTAERREIWRDALVRSGKASSDSERQQIIREARRRTGMDR